MSELIQKNDNRATIRWKLLTGASAVALMAYVSSSNVAKAEDADRPTIWIDLSGQAELMQGLSGPFTADFMSFVPQQKPKVTVQPDVYAGNIFLDNQRPPRFAFGGEAKITFQPQDSDWSFSAGIRYGRAHTKPHEHQQGYGAYRTVNGKNSLPLYAAPFVDAVMLYNESHTIVDFQVGKDVGLGRFGASGSSTISAGVRFAQFSTRSDLHISARPSVGYVGLHYATFNQYKLSGDTERSFHGVGPSIAWKASAALAGNAEHGELTLDWGIDGALLFGRQKAEVDHDTQASHLNHYNKKGTVKAHFNYVPIYPPIAYHGTRMRTISVPDVGGFAGLTAHFKAAKVSIGYRADMFFSAMDTGIDVRKTSNLFFHGPYASISIGLGD